MLSFLKKTIKNNPLFFKLGKQVLLYFRFLKSFLQNQDRYKNTKALNNLLFNEISESGYHCFFGYYDKSPMDISSKYMIYLRVSHRSEPGDFCDICLYDIENNAKRIVGSTNAWNWQQGCMLQWVNKNLISYNAYDDVNKSYYTVILNIENLETVKTKRAVYTYNTSANKYLSLNFYRLDMYAKGYGYPYKSEPLDNNLDGIWESEIHGDPRLVVSISEVIRFNPHYNNSNVVHYINHVSYCPDENYIIFIHRWQEMGGNFISRLLMMNLSNREIITLLDNGHVSHYCWHTKEELLIYATDDSLQKGYLILNIYTLHTRLLANLPVEDGHPSFSNDKNWILTDTYPNNKRYQHLLLYDTKHSRLLILDKLYSPFRYFNDERCDLHPRWSKDNKYVIIDNTSSGNRSLKIYNVNSLIQ